VLSMKDRVIVVTGAAGNLGHVVVQEFLNCHGTVCALDHRERRLADLLSTSKPSGELHCFEGIDITDRSGMVTLAERIQDTVGQVDVVVNTVGGFTSGERVHEISKKTWQRMMELNVESLLNTAAAFIPGMLENGSGKIVAIGSRASLKGTAKAGAYAAAKSVVLRLSESMAAELISYGIQVNCVLPGTIDTPENRLAMPDADYEKWVTPQQIAQAILFLSSSASDAITGTSLPVYGRS
jgi:NAD(P)-dependent dehydrogenase (short-subunit alcohol dehydrogenase family)